MKQLEELNIKKEEKILQLHTRLEEALCMLQSAQTVYADQHSRLEAQNAAIAKLKERVLASKVVAPSPDGSPMASPMSESSSSRSGQANFFGNGHDKKSASAAAAKATLRANARKAASASSRAGAARLEQVREEEDEDMEDEDLEEEDEEVAALQQRARELSALLAAAQGQSLAPEACRMPSFPSQPTGASSRSSQPVVIRGGGGGAARQSGVAGAPARAKQPLQTAATSESSSSNHAAVEAMAREMAMSAAPELMEALGALTAEKTRLETQLQDEQSSLEAQLAALHEQMELLAKLEAESEPID